MTMFIQRVYGWVSSILIHYVVLPVCEKIACATFLINIMRFEAPTFYVVIVLAVREM